MRTAGPTTWDCASSAAATASRCPGPTSRRSPATGSPAPARTSTRSSPAPPQKAGARILERTAVTAPVRDDRSGRIVGVTARTTDADGSKHDPTSPTARRSSSRPTATPAGCRVAAGRERLENRPMGVAVRTYYRSPSFSDDEWLESHLELWDGDKLLPGYGWVFGLGDGTVNVGLGILDSSPAFGKVDYKALMQRWVDRRRRRRTGSPRRPGSSRSAAPPSRWRSTASRTTPTACCSWATPAGMVNPFNGEGIAYAMESGRARRRGDGAGAAPADGVLAREGARRLPAPAHRPSTAATTRSAASS